MIHMEATYTIQIPSEAVVTFYGPVTVTFVDRATGVEGNSASIREAGYPLFIAGNDRYLYRVGPYQD